MAASRRRANREKRDGRPRPARKRSPPPGAGRRHRPEPRGRRRGPARRPAAIEVRNAPDERGRKACQWSEARDGEDREKESSSQLNRLEHVGLLPRPKTGRTVPARETAKSASASARTAPRERFAYASGSPSAREAIQTASRITRSATTAGSHGRPSQSRRIEAAHAPAARSTRSAPKVTSACVETRKRHAVGENRENGAQASARRLR